MAQAGFTPISLYHSSTPAAEPIAGNLANGELAINIADGKLYYKDNLGVVKSISGATATYTRTSFTATGGQTTFSVTYAVGFVQVYLNGVFLNGTDFTATNGTTVVLATGATAGDIVETVAYNISNIGVASTTTNIAGGIASQIVYQASAGSTAFIPNGTSGQALISNGTSAPSFDTLSITGGGTGQTTATAAFNALNPMTTTGDIIYEASATVAARLPIGTTGQVLTVSGGIPAWAAPGGGDYVLISTRTVTNVADISWTGLSGYNNYVLVVNYLSPATANQPLFMQFGTGSGPTYVTSGYGYSSVFGGTTAASINNSGSDSGIRLNLNVNTTATNSYPQNGNISINNMTNGTSLGLVALLGYNRSGSGREIRMVYGYREGTSVYTALKIYFETGNISNGSISLYGIRS